WFRDEGWVSLHTAVDNLQWLAERWHLIDIHGQDAIQAEMAFAFMPANADMPDQVSPRIVLWDLADPRDRWRHTGERPPSWSFRNGPFPKTDSRKPEYQTPQSTIAAFWFVVRLEDETYLTRWLADHPQDAPYLKKLWEAKCRPSK